MIDENRRPVAGADDMAAAPPVAGPSAAERLADLSERLREFGLTLERRLAQPPRGGAALRWAASWLAYLALGAALVGTWLARPPVVVWVFLFVLAAEVSLPVAPERKAKHWLWIFIVALFLGGAAGMVADAAAGARLEALPTALQAALVYAPLLLMAAGALNPQPMHRSVWWAERLGAYAAAGWGVFAVYLLLAGSALSALHPVVAAIDPPMRPVFDAVVQGAAAVLAAAAAVAVIVAVHRLHRGRHEGGV